MTAERMNSLGTKIELQILCVQRFSNRWTISSWENELKEMKSIAILGDVGLVASRRRYNYFNIVESV